VSDDAIVVALSLSRGMMLAVEIGRTSTSAPANHVARGDDMPRQSLEPRVLSLEHRMDDLATIPGRLDRVESQVLQLRGDVTIEFSAVRREMATEFQAVRREMATEFHAVRSEMAAEFQAVRSEMAAGFESVRGEFKAVRGETATGFAAVRTEIAELRVGVEDTRREMRVLHEEVISRLKLLQDGAERSGPAERTRNKRPRN